MLAVVGAGILISYWLPRLVSGREPAASALLIGAGYLAFTFFPGDPIAFDPVAAPKPWEILSELCVVIGLFGVGLRIDKLKLLKTWKPTIRLLAIAMPITIAAVTLVGWTSGMTITGALLLAAVLAPTDPVLAGDVQVGPPHEGGEHPVRFALTTEAGLNDGLAFPFVYIALAIGAAGMLSADMVGEWLVRDVLYRTIVGLISGIMLGWLVSKLLFDWPKDNALSKTESGLVALAGVLIVYGVTELIEGYGFIAVFVAGLTLRRSETNHDYHAKLHDFVETLERALTAILLLGIGAALPALLSALDWQGVAISFALIFIIRPIAAWLSLRGTELNRRAKMVVSFYGIRGIGSVYYLAYAGSHIELIDKAELWAIVAFTIVASTIIHGFTAGLAVDHAVKPSK